MLPCCRVLPLEALRGLCTPFLAARLLPTRLAGKKGLYSAGTVPWRRVATCSAADQAAADQRRVADLWSMSILHLCRHTPDSIADFALTLCCQLPDARGQGQRDAGSQEEQVHHDRVADGQPRTGDQKGMCVQVLQSHGSVTHIAMLFPVLG